jgi:imidazolonepropionase-like amidohydrolase
MPMGLAPGVCLPMGCAIVDGAEAARREVRTQVAHGASWIKAFADWTGHEAVGGAPFVAPTFTPGELGAIVDEAARRRRRVAAHVTSDEGARQAILAGVASLEHMGEPSRATLDLAAERGVVLVPTLSVMRHLAEGAPPGPVRDRMAARWDRCVAAFGRALASGIRIAAGSDVGAYPHALGPRTEVALYVEHGMAPMAAIHAATGAAAALLGTPEVGTIAPGRIADLVAFDYAGDLAAALAGSPRLVLFGGVVVTAPAPARRP